MPDPKRPGRAAVARAIADAAAAGSDPDAPYLRGVVQSVTSGPPRVTVLVTNVGTFRCPYLAHYGPSNGDLVWLGRVAVGSYLCLGRQAT